MSDTGKVRSRSAGTGGKGKTAGGSAGARLSEAELLEYVLLSLGDGVLVVDLAGELLFMNEAAEQIIGPWVRNVSPADWSSNFGCYLPDKKTLYPPERLPLSRALRGEKIRDVEIFIRNARRPRGSWISVNGSPLHDESGRTVGGVAIFRDVTAQRRTYEIVRRLSKAVERTADSVFMTDSAGIIDYVNPAFEETTGYHRSEVLGHKPSILKSGVHDHEYYARLWATVLAGDVHTGTVINRKKNGELYHAEQTITPIKDASGNLTHFVSVVKDVTALKLAKEREVELRLARVVQQKLYPSEPPRVPGFDLAGAAYPANQTCGDYFDFIPMVDDAVAIAIGDVSGHGFPSALYMAETRAYLRSLAKTTTDVSEILGQVNAFLGADTEAGRFVTLMLLRLDPQRRCFVYASAGHPPGYLMGKNGEVRQVLGATGQPLGLFPDQQFTASEEIAFEDGDLLLLLTDGLTEMRNPAEEFFGAERALEVVRNERRRDARGIVEALHGDATRFSDGIAQLDDVTAVVCRACAVD